MSLAISKVPVPVNEPVKAYAPGSPERASLKATLAKLAAETIDMPLVIHGKDVRTAKPGHAWSPHRRAQGLRASRQGGGSDRGEELAARLEDPRPGYKRDEHDV